MTPENQLTQTENPIIVGSIPTSPGAPGEGVASFLDGLPQIAESDAISARFEEWKAGITQELDALLIEASHLQRSISLSTTNVKRAYFKKKAAKITPRVMQMLAALQRLDQHLAPATEAASVTPDEQHATI